MNHPIPRIFYLFSATIVLALDADVSAADVDGGRNWPQWRGETGYGVSSETSLPTTWSDDSNIAWTAEPAGTGVSAPIVWDNHVIVTSQVGATTVRRGSHPFLARDDPRMVERENAIAIVDATEGAESADLVIESFDRSSGDRNWIYQTKSIGPFSQLHKKHNLATPTPVTDGKQIYAWFGNGQVVCVDLKGRNVWTRHLGKDYGTFINHWGHGASPTLYEDLLILLVDHQPNAYLLALDAGTGEERWHIDRGSDRVSHATPVLVPGPEGDELIVNSTKRIDVFDPSTGKLLWYLGSYRQTPIPTPVVKS